MAFGTQMPCSLRCRTDIYRIVKCFVCLPSPQIRAPLITFLFQMQQSLNTKGGCSIHYAKLYFFLQLCFLWHHKRCHIFLCLKCDAKSGTVLSHCGSIKFCVEPNLAQSAFCAKSLKNSFLIKILYSTAKNVSQYSYTRI